MHNVNRHNAKRCSIAILIIALTVLPQSQVRGCGCCCIERLETGTEGSAGESCETAHHKTCCCPQRPNADENTRASGPPHASGKPCCSCESCKHDCQCRKRIEQNKIVRNDESHLLPTSPPFFYFLSLNYVLVAGVLLVTLDRGWLNSSYNRRRAMESVWLK